ncbi:DODA-type extradiol aromatic ring-opening family dioxygenase [Segnochrobactrum spirostomi]|uniref:Dioxygenase n=1 Tax=Segnochrobactrum spirostomi TaxID=2608987 RepID=A0A6A7XZ91_9HYPH|nr:class III extradiol ring-cleavage dioxygenase [Segnochrobactrum spirostomi]MQT11231.1 dioxygenase [Segnochrobactrum spirostomi]
MLPTVFVSHGSPNMALFESPARRFMKGLAATLPRPKAILSVSAHFTTAVPVVIADEKPEMIYDFGGFERELYEMVYPAPGSPVLAEKIGRQIAAAGFDARLGIDRGFDHGTWVPLSLIYPDADIPVVQLSIQPRQDAAYHYRLGQALQGLADEGILVMASGSLTHNLNEVFDRRRGGMRPLESANEPWAEEFSAWVADRLDQNAVDDLLAYRTKAPHAARNHPTDEHLLPLYVALGAAGAGASAERVHTSGQFGALMMDAYLFHPAAAPESRAA